MKFIYSERVARWAEPGDNGKSPIDVALEDLETDVICDVDVLSLIAVESMGNPSAHRHGSQFYGLLQMGRYAGLDVGMEDLGRHTTKGLSGNGIAALVAFVEYVNRYADRVYSPESVAVLWKGGPGTAKAVLEAVEDGTDFDDAVDKAEAGELDNTPIGNLSEYVRRFRGFKEVYHG